MSAEKLSTVKYAFSGHETFPFRFTWLPKGVQLTHGHPDLFTREDALVALGVGKNMVRSIRHWCTATGVIERTDRKGTHEATKLGSLLFGDEGWDPYLEDPGTLWLLHWQLVKNPIPASTWHLAFTRWNTVTFDREKLISWLKSFVGGVTGTQPTESSLRRDVDVFIRTYAPIQGKRGKLSEDTFDCPLVELGLLEEREHGAYRFVRGLKETLPDEIFAYALLDYWVLNSSGERTLSFESVLHGHGSPGSAFKLSENALAEKLERLPEWTGITLDDTAGLRNLIWTGKSEKLEPIEALSRYFGGTFDRLGDSVHTQKAFL